MDNPQQCLVTLTGFREYPVWDLAWSSVIWGKHKALDASPAASLGYVTVLCSNPLVALLSEPCMPFHILFSLNLKNQSFVWTFKFCFFFFFNVCMHMCVEVRGQLSRVRFLPTSGSILEMGGTHVIRCGWTCHYPLSHADGPCFAPDTVFHVSQACFGVLLI